ncbi:haloacid dehalogenase-like hydrolase domain-containing protein 3 isoform X1 [Apostichopus japonicus]|uniref:haloacid dehalogenase-like hydrolase domain-containing protein 3 isoform X1 n=1 Tax=Stichopus japonicus TaxID=307972 RepID=UPI003AB16110
MEHYSTSVFLRIIFEFASTRCCCHFITISCTVCSLTSCVTVVLDHNFSDQQVPHRPEYRDFEKSKRVGKMLRFKMITFDANQTLIKVRRTVGYHYVKFAQRFSVEGANRDSLDENFGVAFAKQRKTHPNFGKHSGMSTKKWWGDVLGETFQLAGSPVREDILQQMNEEFYEYAKTAQLWEVFPEVKEMLTFLNRNGVCLGVLSDNDERLIEVLRNLNIASHFAFILPSVHADAEKPDSSLFKLAMDRLRLSPTECAHIGNSYERDFEGAKSVGMHSFLIDRDETFKKKYPNLGNENFIADLTDLEKMIFERHIVES